MSVEFKDVKVVLGGNIVLDSVSASVPSGSCSAIIGPNGAGKTTLLLALLSQINYQGEIAVASNSASQTPRIGYVPQQLTFDRNMPITVMEFMVMGKQRLPLSFGVRKKHRQHALEVLSVVKADSLANRRLGALSGGELQRVLLALALDQEPDLLVLDEPAAGIDLKGEYIFCELLEQLRQERGFTQLMVSHDLPTVTHHATHVICLNHKVIAQGRPKEVLTTETLTAIFGMHMGLVDSKAIATGEGSCSAKCCSEGKSND